MSNFIRKGTKVKINKNVDPVRRIFLGQIGVVSGRFNTLKLNFVDFEFRKLIPFTKKELTIIK